MNRKERRAQEKKQGKTPQATLQQTAKAGNDRAEQLKQHGMTLRTQGRDAEAIEPLTQALSLNSGFADAHFTLAMIARSKPDLKLDMEDVNRNIKDKELLINSYLHVMAVMRQKRQYKEAVICQEEICRLTPDDASNIMDLGLLLNIAGDAQAGTITMSRALNMNPDDKILKGVFSSGIDNPQFQAFYPEVKKAISCCFENIYDVHLRNFWYPWVSVMNKDPVFATMNKALMMNEEDFLQWADSLTPENSAFLRDSFFLGGLKRLIIADRLLETLLARLRRYICVNFDEMTRNGRFGVFESFLVALAEQCFFNEYLFMETPEEKDSLVAIRKQDTKQAIILTSCYEPMFMAFKDKKDLLESCAATDPDFANLYKVQFQDHQEEQLIKGRIETFGDFANAVSQAVQNQYEENPYPRWTTVATTPLPNDDILFRGEQQMFPYRILIAGCGTGRQAINTAVRYPNAIVTAIDLSRSSIAYGTRKAQEAGLNGRIKFVHADILSMKDWPDSFDMIECSGVLHHMEDPFHGWETLTGKLNKNGCMKIGLYSDIARQPIVQARELVAQNGFPPTPDGIRACRKMIFDMPMSDPIRRFVSASADFYTTSNIRDLIFHVQEHRMTLPQIKGMMDRLGLACIKFLISNPRLIYLYDKKFPQDLSRSDFSNLEAFETENPLAFAGMYQFWCQKPDRS